MNLLVWDLETVPDLEGFARANGIMGKSNDEIRAALGDDFPKHIYHSIICIGALVAERGSNGWTLKAVGAPHIGERTEQRLIQSFVDKIDEIAPQMVTFNGCSFDLPVLRYRAMIHSVAAPGLSGAPYFHRFTDHAVDLCDVFSSYSPSGKVRLDQLSRIMNLPGKPDGIDGSKVESYFSAGRIQEIADNCKTDVINTYRLWLRYELFRGKLTRSQFELSEQDVIRFTAGE